MNQQRFSLKRKKKIFQLTGEGNNTVHGARGKKQTKGAQMGRLTTVGTLAPSQHSEPPWGTESLSCMPGSLLLPLRQTKRGLFLTASFIICALVLNLLQPFHFIQKACVGKHTHTQNIYRCIYIYLRLFMNKFPQKASSWSICAICYKGNSKPPVCLPELCSYQGSCNYLFGEGFESLQ